MTKRCLDEGLLQAFIDGELPRGQAGEAAAHLAACDSCAAALSAAEQESAFFATAFAPDESLVVPSEILRSRIGAAVAQLEPAAEPAEARREGRNFGGLLASFKGLFSFTPQGATAFAGLLAVVTLSVIYFSTQRPQPAPAGGVDATQIARNEPAPAPQPALTHAPEGTAPETAEPGAAGQGTASAAGPGTVPAPAKLNPGAGAAGVNSGARRAPGGGVRPRGPAPAPKEEALPGEGEYRTAIASLEKTIELGGEESLRPSLRAEYERNLAVLDSAIKQTRQVAAQNPEDRDAVGFLMAAYQSKVELLSKVADQAQAAALGR
jgi:hypothetical protein